MAESPPMKRAARRSRLNGAAVLLALVVVFPAWADDDIHGRIELQNAGSFARDDSIDALLGVQNRNDVSGNIRLTWEPTWERWSVSLHYLANFQYGDSVPLARTILVPSPPDNWFNLSDTFEDRARLIATHRIDRLSVAYATPDFVVRLGRQALTWGSGIVFRPMDLFNPFSPSATDTEYKPGSDMAYAQLLFDDGSDLQAIAVPRPALKGAEPSWHASSFALHFHTVLLGHQTTLLVASDHGDWVGGIGVNGALAEATWNVEFVPTLVDKGAARFSGLANISDAVTLFDRNATLFAEYFHNGFGVRNSAFTLATLPADLLDRLGRGQVFNLRQNFLAGGISLEVNPLLTVSPSIIACLDDASTFVLAAATYSLSDNLTLVGGVQVPLGASDTEFGGLPTKQGSGTFVAPPTRVYLQIRQYF